MALSTREQSILAGIEEGLNRDDPELSDLLTHRSTATTAHHRIPLSLTGVGLLAVVLLALVLVAPMAAGWGAAGVGLLTVALIIPWMVVTAHTTARPERGPDPGPGRVDQDRAMRVQPLTSPERTDARPRARRFGITLGLAVWALLLALVAVSAVGLVDAALTAVALVMLVGVHVARWHARRALFRRFGAAGDTRSDWSHQED